MGTSLWHAQVARHPVQGSSQLHELALFTAELWADFVEYMRRARSQASSVHIPPTANSRHLTLRVQRNLASCPCLG